MEELQKLREQLRELEYRLNQLEQPEQWEPQGGEWFVSLAGSLGHAESDRHCREFGLERRTKELATKARNAMRTYNRALAYVHEHAPDWDGSDPYRVVQSPYTGACEVVKSPAYIIGVVVGPKEVMQLLADDLNSGRVKL